MQGQNRGLARGFVGVGMCARGYVHVLCEHICVCDIGLQRTCVCVCVCMWSETSVSTS